MGDLAIGDGRVVNLCANVAWTPQVDFLVCWLDFCARAFSLCRAGVVNESAYHSSLSPEA